MKRKDKNIIKTLKIEHKQDLTNAKINFFLLGAGIVFVIFSFALVLIADAKAMKELSENADQICKDHNYSGLSKLDTLNDPHNSSNQLIRITCGYDEIRLNLSSS